MPTPRPCLTRLSLLSVLILGLIPLARAQPGDQTVYSDALQNGWQNYGWATLNYANPTPTHAGADSISVAATGYQALYLHHVAQDSTPYASLSFWINGGAGGQQLQVQATLNGGPQTAVPLGPLPANTWQKVTIGLDKLGVANNSSFDGFWIQDTTGASQPTYYVDDVTLSAGTIIAPPNAAVTVSVDASAGRHPISPLIYGVAYGSTAELSDLNAPLNRMGGNNTSRYNWQLNADNRANDYFFESIGDASAVPGERGDTFIAGNKSAGADTMLTIPMIPYIAKLGPNRGKIASFSVAKYGAQQSTDPYMPDAGNGVKTGGTNIAGNDPTDANVPNSADFESGWISHLIGQWGQAANGGLKYYLMDNEPSIWFGTHRDVHPAGPTMDEIKGDILAYAAKVKSADPSALVVGPEEWGWSGYFYSGYDQQYGAAHGYSSYPDRAAHSGMDYLPWMLDQFRQNNAATGQRLLDIFSVHFYPQGGEFGNDTSSNTDLLRNRSTRQLWDPNYTSESWINDKVQLIPRIKGWVNTYYPGTKTAVTEYNWGAESDINGATTQADIDGIFGREGLDLATRWTTPDPSTPTYKAMKLYRNYDGSKGSFGDTSVSDTVPNPDNLSSFAAVRSSDGALTVMVISKVLQGDTPVTISTASFAAGPSAQVWQLTGQNTISRLASVTVTNGVLTATVPAQSVTLFVISAAQQATVSGTVALQSVASGHMAQPLTFTLTPTGTTTGGVTTQTVTPDAATGRFTLSNVPAGTFTLGVKGASWLRRDVSIDTTGGNVSGLAVSLLGGDLNGDNVVDINDFILLRQQFNRTGTGLVADINCDGQVDINDFILLRSNFNSVGNP